MPAKVNWCRISLEKSLFGNETEKKEKKITEFFCFLFQCQKVF